MFQRRIPPLGPHFRAWPGLPEETEVAATTTTSWDRRKAHERVAECFVFGVFRRGLLLEIVDRLVVDLYAIHIR